MTMANVYMSVLGASKYFPCTYVHNQGHLEEAFSNVVFVQEATAKLMCRNWSKEDRIVIFLTDLARERNWIDGGQDTGSRGLGAALRTLGLQPSIEDVRIKDGRDQQEIWENFDLILGEIKNGDSIVFDITHSFRYLPMLAIIVLNYAKVTRSVKIEKILYGNWEAREGDRAPIVDLTPFDTLLDWTSSVDLFIKAGDSSRASQLLAQTPASIDPDATDHLAARMIDFTRNMATCRSKLLSSSASRLKQAAATFQRIASQKVLLELMSYLESGLQTFTGDEVQDMLAAVEWCLKHHLIQQGFTILNEGLVTFLCLKAGQDHTNDVIRQIASSAPFCVSKDEQEWKGKAGEHKDITREIIAVLRDEPDLLKFFKGKLRIKIASYRNDLNHAGFAQPSRESVEFEEKLREIIEEVKQLLQHA